MVRYLIIRGRQIIQINNMLILRCMDHLHKASDLLKLIMKDMHHILNKLICPLVQEALASKVQICIIKTLGVSSQCHP